MKNKLSQFLESRGDSWGVFISLLCLIHCLAIPLLLFLSPALSHHFEHELIHIIILIMVIPLVFTSLSQLKTSQAHRYILYIGPIGVLFLIAAIAVEFLHHQHHGSFTSELLSSIGSILLVIFHWHNLKVRKKEANCCKTDIAH